MSKIKSVNITIEGRVQNVGFRYHCNEKAREFGVNGFAKNLPNGSVYIEAEAEENSLNQFIVWCHHGPNWALVTEVNITNQPVIGFKIFEIRR